MNSLRRGDRGKSTEGLQRALMRAGFRPGSIDGIFGRGTMVALKSFQKSEGLVVDGVAGRRTFAALGMGKAIKKSSTTKCRKSASLAKRFPVNDVAKLFQGAPKKKIKTYLPPILKALKAAGLDDTEMVLMALATIKAESAGFAPIDEYKSKYNTSPGGKPFDLYDNRKDIGNRGRPDGASYKGRGFIQLTGRANYVQIGKKIGLGSKLAKTPKLANDPVVAAKILAAFLKAKRKKIKQALAEGDLRRARRLVNGGSHGLKQFSACYKKGMKLFG